MVVVPFSCALDVVMFASDIWTATTKSQIQRKLVLEWNGPWHQEQGKMRGSYLENATASLNPPLLFCALVFTQDLHSFTWVSIGIGCRRSPREKRPYPFLFLWDGPELEAGLLLTLVQWGLRILEHRVIQHFPRHDWDIIQANTWVTSTKCSLSLAFPTCFRFFYFLFLLPVWDICSPET